MTDYQAGWSPIWIQEALRSILERSEIISTSVVDGGLWSDVYRVSLATGDVIVKRYRDADTNRTFGPVPVSARDRFDISTATHRLARECLVDEGIAVPDLLCADPATRAVVMAVAPGSPLLNHLVRGVALPVMVPLGNSLRRFHDATVDRPELLCPALERSFKKHKIELQYAALRPMLGIRAWSRVSELVESYAAEAECVVHGDLNSRNVLVTEGGRSAAVIDFEQAHLGARVFDVAYLLSELFLRLKVHRWASLRSAITDFAKGYGSAFSGDGESFRREVARHLWPQLIYRFTGPSRMTWTGDIGRAVAVETCEWAAGLLVASDVDFLDVANGLCGQIRSALPDAR